MYVRTTKFLIIVLGRTFVVGHAMEGWLKPATLIITGESQTSSDAMEEWLKPTVVYLSHIIELVGACVIALALVIFVYRFTVSHLGITPHRGNIELRVKFGSYLTLVLELLLGADILVTAVAPTWDDIGKLAAIAAVRTVLNYFLERDLKAWAQEKGQEADLNEQVAKDSKLTG